MYCVYTVISQNYFVYDKNYNCTLWFRLMYYLKILFIRYQYQIIILKISAIADVGGPGWTLFVSGQPIFSDPILHSLQMKRAKGTAEVMMHHKILFSRPHKHTTNQSDIQPPQLANVPLDRNKARNKLKTIQFKTQITTQC